MVPQLRASHLHVGQPKAAQHEHIGLGYVILPRKLPHHIQLQHASCLSLARAARHSHLPIFKSSWILGGHP